MTFVVLLGACARWPRLEPVRTEGAGWNEAFRAAGTIVVGRVVAVDSGPRRLLRVRVEVENVLQGDRREGAAEVFCYLDPGLTPRPRERYVFFLAHEQNVLRAVWDYHPSAIPVASGLHRGSPLRAGPAEGQVSALLLTPGEEMNAGHFVRELPAAVTFAMDHIGRWQTAKLLKQLSADERAAIRRAACTQLTARYWGQDACWDQLGDGPPIGTTVSRASEQERRASTADPDRWWKQMSAASPPAELLDELRLLTTHKDPRIRAMYCRFLRAHYPNEKDCGCDAPVAAGGAGQASI